MKRLFCLANLLFAEEVVGHCREGRREQVAHILGQDRVVIRAIQMSALGDPVLFLVLKNWVGIGVENGREAFDATDFDLCQGRDQKHPAADLPSLLVEPCYFMALLMLPILTGQHNLEIIDGQPEHDLVLYREVVKRAVKDCISM
ncbi:hypothetical protein D3C80_18180 [compost metagenome]